MSIGVEGALGISETLSLLESSCFETRPWFADHGIVMKEEYKRKS